MSLRRLTRDNGQIIWIESRQVAFLESMGQAVTAVRFAFVSGAGEWPYHEVVQGGIDAVAAALNDEPGDPMEEAQRGFDDQFALRLDGERPAWHDRG